MAKKNDSKSKTTNKKMINKKNIKRYTIELVFIILILISVFKILMWFNDNSKSKKNIKKIKEHVEVVKDEDGVDEYTIDFNSLKEQNSDVVAYLVVDGTNIEYPLVKTYDNTYYLSRSFDKTFNEAGWPFINFENKLDGTDKNISIFGHARLDGSMFGTLKDTLTSPWQDNEENFIIKFITGTEELKYQVFSTYKIKVEDYYIKANFSTNQEFETFINIIKSRSNKDYGVEVNINDQIITLSTCDINNDYRIVLHAKKINEY